MLFLLTTITLVGFMVRGASAAEWIYVGDALLPKGERVSMFYDPSSVDKTSTETLRVWTKSVAEPEISRLQVKLKTKIVEVLADKIVNGYLAPTEVDHPTAASARCVLELVANFPDTRPRMKDLTEIDCNTHRRRRLSVTLFDSNGAVSASDNTSESTWHYVAPESNEETLMNILCRQRDPATEHTHKRAQ